MFDLESVLGHPGAVRFLHLVRAGGLPMAVASGSANCAAVLEAAGIANRFDARVDDQALERDHLGGRPTAASFAFAARIVVPDLADLLA